MNLRQQIIDDRIKEISKSLSIAEDKAFSKFIYSLIVGKSLYDLDESDFVDGGGDKQIDIFSIDDSNSESSSVYIIQVKNSESFSMTDLVKLKSGLEWIFEKNIEDVSSLVNEKLKNKISDFRTIQRNLGPSNINLEVYFISRGVTSLLSDEFKEEAKTIVQKLDNKTFSSFSLKIFGADELVDVINSNEKRDRKVSANINIKYDANNPSLIKYHIENIKGLVCTTTAEEIAKIINEDSTGFIFDLNIRRFLGTRGSVNTAIMNACISESESKLFWFLNNGITIICDNFDPVTDPDSPIVKVTNMQIVNGCQTASTLALAFKEGTLRPETRILLRIYEAPSTDLVDKIVLTTNNQNKITNRNLKSNDSIQIDMEKGFLRYKYYYERKPNQYKKDSINSKNILSNEFVAQSYLAVILKKPSDARRRKYKVWGELYDQIFSNREIEQYLISALICRACSIELQKYGEDSNEIRRKLANNGLFHVARITSFLWNDGDTWKDDLKLMQQKLADIETNGNLLENYIKKALDVLKEVIESKSEFITNIDTSLKANYLDTLIESHLYQKRSQLPLI